MPSLFWYNYTIANYVLGEAIVDNKPFIYGILQSPYSISPAFDNGLIFNPATGVISGTPTKSTAAEVIIFTITASIKYNDQLPVTETALIYMDIADFNPPYNVKFYKNQDVLPTNEVNLVTGESVTVSVKNEGNATSYEMDSPYIEGFSFNRLTVTYEGICSQPFSQK